MFIFSPKYILYVFISIIILQITIIRVESRIAWRVPKVRRMQSMQVASYNSKFDSVKARPEKKLQPLVEGESKHVRFSSSASLIDPMAMTHGPLDPRRDGYFARIRMRERALHNANRIAAKERLFKNDGIIKQPINQTEASLIDPMAMTYGPLDPRRDGYFARMRMWNRALNQ